MVHRGGLETSTAKNKKDDFNIAENAKTADDENCNTKTEQSSTKIKKLKKTTNKVSPKTSSLPLTDHSISQTVVRLERSRLIKSKNHPISKTEAIIKTNSLSPVRAGLRSSSLESHTSTTSNKNNAKGKKKKINNKKTNAKPIESPPSEEAVNNLVSVDTKNSQTKSTSKLPLSLVCSLPLGRLSGILEKLKTDKTKCLPNVDEDTSTEDKLNVDQNSNQCKTLCLYCDKRMSTVKVRTRHIERFHTISKERRSSTRNPIIPSQDSKDPTGSPSTCSSSSAPSTPISTIGQFFNGCSFCSKSPKLQAVALENDLSALFHHLIDFHSDKYFGCKLCAIRFQNAAKLGDHVQRTHTQASRSTQPIEEVNPPSNQEDERSLSEFSKDTPTKTRRQLKQSGADVFVSPSKASTSTISRNGSMFSDDEPILSRLGVTQNRLPRGRKGIRSRRQTNVDGIKPDTSLLNPKARNKVGRTFLSNEPVETVFRTPTNTRIEPLSCTFDEDFYEKVFSNVRTNLSCHLDGKLGTESDVTRPQSPPPLMPAIRSTVVKSPHILESEVHTATSLAALTAFPTLLTAEQYGCDFGTAKIKRPITRHSWKWKWDSVKKYKYVNEGGKIVKKIKQPMLGLRDLSKLDMWTQLTMRQKHEVVRKQSETATNSTCLVKFSESSREEKQKQIDQLNTILDSRRLPQIILEQNEQTIIKLEISDEGFRYLSDEMIRATEEPSTSLALDRIIPANLNLIPSRSLSESLRQSVVLSGEWARPRCYVCFGCGARFDKLKALEEHKMFRHPHVYSTHYEIVGRELIEGNLYKHFFIPQKALSRHREYAQRIVVNKKTEFSVSKSASNSGNEDESLDSLHSVTASFTTLSSSKLSDDCDTDTKTAIENVSSFAGTSTLCSKDDNNSMIMNISPMECTKCNRNCNGMLDLYKHMLDCSGDYAWILAKKKKYRYYGSRRRRQFNKQNISSLHLHRRKIKEAKDENESDETPKKKSTNMSPTTPRPRASDADSIRKMLENLPAKRVCREIIPNATKPRVRKFKTNVAGRKLQQKPVNKCKTSNTAINAISKKILRNHKLRAISEKDKKILRNNKILENKRKSARVKSRIHANKNVHPENKTNKKTEKGNNSIVRKIGATTKRFVKKIKKRILGEKKIDEANDKEAKVEKSAEKKSPKLTAARKLTFDSEQSSEKVKEITNEEPKCFENKSNFIDTVSLKNKNEKIEATLKECKIQIPTIRVENDVESKILHDTPLNDNSSLRSEGSTENLHQNLSELSASTEDLQKSNPNFLSNQVSPTTKRRSKKINDCIAMLTGKIQEKLGKPFLECKETQGAETAKSQSIPETPIVKLVVEIKDTKPPKRKALSRRIVKCDQSNETSTNSDATLSATESPTKVHPIITLPPAVVELPVKEPPPKRATVKESPIKAPPLKDHLKAPPLKDNVKTPPLKDHLKAPPIKDHLKALPLKDQPLETPCKEILSKQQPEKELLPKKQPDKDTPPKQQHKETLPIQKQQYKEPPPKDQLFKELTHERPPMEHHLTISPLVNSTVAKPQVTIPRTMEILTTIESKQNNEAPAVINKFKPSPVKKAPPLPVTIEITTPSPVILNEIPNRIPVLRNTVPKQQQHCVINADTIRVPCIQPPQLNIPQFNPVQIPPPRGMIAKRRQTIAGAPNDFFCEINTAQRCSNTYNDLPFELEVPLDLSKKPKRSSPKSKPAPKAIPPHFPQISVKPNAVLMPPIPYSLPILPQTQIIPILCDSIQSKMSQIPLQSPPILYPKENPKPVVNTPRKRATNNKKQEPILLNTNLQITNFTPEVSPPKKQSKRINVISEDKLKAPITPVLPIKHSTIVREPMLSLPLKSFPELTISKTTPPAVANNLKDFSETVTQVKKVTLEQPQEKDLNLEGSILDITPTPLVPPVIPEITVSKSIPDTVSTSEPKELILTNMKGTKAKPNKKGSKKISSPLNSNNSTMEDDKVPESVNSSDSKGQSSPESHKSLPTRRSRRNKAGEQIDKSPIEQTVKSAAQKTAKSPVEQIVDPPPVEQTEKSPALKVPPSALKEVEEIAASFLTDDEQENEVLVPSNQKESPPKEDISPIQDDHSKEKNEVILQEPDESLPTETSTSTEKNILPIEEDTIPVGGSNKEITKSNNIDSNKKPRRRRKNELAAIVADQLLESFKEVDKNRIDDLKRLENLAYEKSEDLLLTGMRLMPTTKRKNVLESKKEFIPETADSTKPSIPSKEGKKQKSETNKETEIDSTKQNATKETKKQKVEVVKEVKIDSSKASNQSKEVKKDKSEPIKEIEIELAKKTVVDSPIPLNPTKQGRKQKIVIPKETDLDSLKLSNQQKEGKKQKAEILKEIEIDSLKPTIQQKSGKKLKAEPLTGTEVDSSKPITSQKEGKKQKVELPMETEHESSKPTIAQKEGKKQKVETELDSSKPTIPQKDGKKQKVEAPKSTELAPSKSKILQKEGKRQKEDALKESETDSSRLPNPLRDTKIQKPESTKGKPSKISTENAEVFKDPMDIPKMDVKTKNQKEDTQPVKLLPMSKEDLKSKLQPLDFGNYRSNSVDSWSNRIPTQQNLGTSEKSPNSDVAVGGQHKKNKKKQTKKRDKKLETENINQLRTGLESFTFNKDIAESVNEEFHAMNRCAEPPACIGGLFAPVQRNTAGQTKEGEISAFGSICNVKTTSSILRPSILAASLDIATNKENPTQSDRKSNISSRDPRLNKNIHTEDGDQGGAAPETTSRLATLRTRRKSFADVNPLYYGTRTSSRSTTSKRSNAGSRRNSLAFDDDEDDNYLTAIAKRVNDKIMSAEDKDFNLANDGFSMANSFLDMEDPFGRPSTSMSVRSAPNFNDDRSNMDTMDNTNTDLIDMDVDDDMSVYTTFSQDTTRSKGGRRRRRRRSILLTRKPKKTNMNTIDPSETYDCLLCNKTFAKAQSLSKHQLTIAHVSKVSEQEYLNATKKQEEAQKVSTPDKNPLPVVTSTPIEKSPKQHFNAIQVNRQENLIVPSKVTEIPEKSIEKVNKPFHPKVPYIPMNSILNQSGIEPISSPEQNFERYPSKTSSRLTLNPDERLFYECCNILKGSETPLVERTYPIVPPTTYAYDLQVKPVTPKSTNERYSYIKQSASSEINGKRESGAYPRLDINQFSDISSDSNPACAQPPPILPVNYAQMHVLSGAKDQAVLPNDEGDGGASSRNIPRENPVLQMASLGTPNLVPPLTARTFVNQPSQIGTHLHGMEGAATATQKQNFISPLHSASSQSSTITTTTCRLKTKAAMKGYDNLKVSIPTIGLDMEHALERSPRPGCKLTTLADIALGNETPMTALTSFTPSSMQISNHQKSKTKIKPNDILENFPALLNQPKPNETSPPSTKKREKSPIKESSLIISVHDTESCMPMVLSPPKKPESIIPKDIYEFDDSENTPISKAIQSPFKLPDDSDAGPKKPIIIPERPFKNIGLEEKETIKFQKPETPAINDENTTSTITYSDRDDFVYGSISGGDDDNDNDNENEDNKETHMNSDESSNSSAFTAKTFENKSLIMGRIFRNAKTKPKIQIENPILPTPEPPKQIPKQELDRLFDTLRGLNENRQANASKEDRQENTTNSSRKRENQSGKRKTSAAVGKASKNKANTNKPTKRMSKKEEHSSKEMAKLHAELGMSPAEIAELIGEGQRKSQRRCAVNRPKKLVEIWSSDEFEEFLSTKDIIALIEEKEQKTKKKRKSSTSGTRKSNSATRKDADDQTTVTEDSVPILPQKNEIETPNTAAQASKPTKPDNSKKTKQTRGRTKVTPTTTANVMPPSKSTSKTQKETIKPSTSRTNSSDNLKSNSSSPFKKPTQRNIISKAADDSESDFEAELNRKSRSGPIRNRRKTICGKLENDAGSSNSSKKSATAKPKATAASTVSRKSSNTKNPTTADSQITPQARRKRIASEMLYYWSSSSDEEFGRIESPHDDEHHIDEGENYQQHGWIVGDSHKKLVTLLAIAKGNKKVDDCGVKETNSKKKS